MWLCGPPLNTQVGKSLPEVELGLEWEGSRYRGSWDRQEWSLLELWGNVKSVTCALAQWDGTTPAWGWAECGERKSPECVDSTQKLPEHGSHSVTTIPSLPPFLGPPRTSSLDLFIRGEGVGENSASCSLQGTWRPGIGSS